MAIWQHEKVLPYVLGELRERIEKISPVTKIYLFGSRARVPVAQWHTLEGKDWDIWTVCNFPIKNTEIFTKQLNYHIDLKITGEKEAKLFLSQGSVLELYPLNCLTLDIE